MREKLHKKVRLIAVYALTLSLLTVCALGAVTYSRFSRSDEWTDGGSVAQAVAKYEHRELRRNEETIPIDRTAETLEITDIQPRDEIRYLFSVSDTDGAAHNETLLRITVSVSVRLEMLNVSQGGESIEKVYFEGWKDYENGLRAGAELQLFHDNGDSTVAIAPGELDGVDYTGKALYVEGGETDGFFNRTGFYLPPFGGTEREEGYVLTFRLPDQALSAENYAGAKLCIDVNVTAEQTQA